MSLAAAIQEREAARAELVSRALEPLKRALQALAPREYERALRAVYAAAGVAR